MRLKLSVAIMLSALNFGMAWAAPQPVKKVALLIANSKYENSKLSLETPRNDVNGIAQVLANLGFEVIVKHDLNRQGMFDAIYQYGRTMGEDKGITFFYYAGHGAEIDGTNYLLPVDIKVGGSTGIDFNQSIETQGIQFEQLQKGAGMLATIEGRANIIVLDACRNNPGKPKTRSVRGLTRGLGDIKPTTGSLTLYSANKDEEAFDRNPKKPNIPNSLFAGHLIEALKTNAGAPVEQMFKQVISNVRKDSDNQQHAILSSQLESDFRFLETDSGQVVSTVELEIWSTIKSSTNPNIFRNFLKQFPNGTYKDAALAKLEDLESRANDESAREQAKRQEQERIAREQSEAQRIANEKAAQSKLAAEKMERERLAREKAEADRMAQAKAEAQRQARIRAEEEKLALEKSQAERLAYEKAEKARIAKEKYEQERITKAQADAERLAMQRAEQARLATEKEEKERYAQEQAEAERMAKQKAEQSRLAMEKAEKDRQMQEQQENERLAKEKAEQTRIANEKAEQKWIAQERDEAARLAWEESEKNRLQKEKDEQRRIAREQKEAERIAQEKSEQARLAKLQSDQEKAEQDKLKADEEQRLAQIRDGKAVQVAKGGERELSGAEIAEFINAMSRDRGFEHGTVRPGSNSSDLRGQIVFQNPNSQSQKRGNWQIDPAKNTYCEVVFPDRMGDLSGCYRVVKTATGKIEFRNSSSGSLFWAAGNDNFAAK